MCGKDLLMCTVYTLEGCSQPRELWFSDILMYIHCMVFVGIYMYMYILRCAHMKFIFQHITPRQLYASQQHAMCIVFTV